MANREQQREASADVEAVIGRVLLVGTVIGIGLIAIGVVLMAANGISPESGTFPPFQPGTLVADLAALRPEGYLWAGLVILIATPIARVIGEVVVFAVRGDRVMAGVAVAILGVIVLSVVVAILLAG